MMILQPRMHLKTHTLRFTVRFMYTISPSLQILAMHFKPIRIYPIRRNKHIPLCLIETHSSIVRLVPLKRRSYRIRLLRVRVSVTLVRRRGSLLVWRMSLVLVEVYCSYIMYARSSLVFSTWKLPYEVLLSMASHLCGRSSDHEITRNVSPVSFSILFKPQKKQPANELPEFHVKN